MLKRAFLLSIVIAVLWPASAHAVGIFDFDPATATVTFTAEPTEQDDIAIFATSSTLRLVNFGSNIIGPGPQCRFVGSGANPAIDCPLHGVRAIRLPGGRFRPSGSSPAAFRAATRAFRRVAAIETRT